ncbi:MAG: beta-lactamase family protein [Clostridia bacterium]|nr:beta-lactamase family protein [Clostridia bacterium]
MNSDKNLIMENLAREAHERGVFNGIWLYAENGTTVSKGAYGFRDAEDRLPMTEDGIFELASVSKQFCAAAIMILVREEKLSLEDKIVKFFPELTAYPDVTVRHLLTHTGGVPDFYGQTDRAPWMVETWLREKTIAPNTIALRFLLESGEGPRFAPGERHEYSNTGYCLLAEIAERVSGEPFEDLLKTRIFDPAGMASTSVRHIYRDGIPDDRYVRNLVLEDGKYVLPIDSKDEFEDVATDGTNGNAHVYTTVSDMLAWDRALREGKVLTHAEQRIMYTAPRLSDGSLSGEFPDELDGYGFGWGILRDEKLGLLVNHSGGMSGLQTWFERGVDADRAFVLVNSRDCEDARAHLSFFEGMVAVTRDGEPGPIQSIEEIAAGDPDRSLWQNFCGKYECPEDTGFTVEEVFLKDGDLWATALSAEYGRISFRLYPLGGNKFGRKGGFVEIEFGDGCLTVDEVTSKKTN